ncbi:hypothetical protein NPIL_54291, partial [Nephila pilipes]
SSPPEPITKSPSSTTDITDLTSGTLDPITKSTSSSIDFTDMTSMPPEPITKSPSNSTDSSSTASNATESTIKPTSILLGDDKDSHRIIIYSGSAAAGILGLIGLVGLVAFFLLRKSRRRGRSNYIHDDDASSTGSAHSTTCLA